MDVVQQMRLHQDPEIQKQLDKLWGKTSASSEQKQTQMKRLHDLIVKQRTASKTTGTATASALPSTAAFDRGHELFKKNCAQRTTPSSAKGARPAPASPATSDNLNFLLLAVVDPSAAIREEFTQFIVVPTDGRVLNGLIDKQDARTVTPPRRNNQATLLNRDDIDELKATETSIMPDGLTGQADRCRDSGSSYLRDDEGSTEVIARRRVWTVPGTEAPPAAQELRPWTPYKKIRRSRLNSDSGIASDVILLSTGPTTSGRASHTRCRTSSSSCTASSG